MTSPLERRRNLGDKESRIDIVRNRQIGHGSYGDVYEADVTVSVGERSKRTAKFVMKTFRDYHKLPGETISARTLAEQAITNYDAAKAAGLKVFNTYRLLEDEPSIVMTNGHTEEQVCIGSNFGSNKIANFRETGLQTLDQVPNIEDLIEAVFQHAKLAEERGMVLPDDSLFFLVNRTNPHELDFVVGDLDGVHPSQDTRMNPLYAHRSLERFIDHNFISKKKELMQLLLETLNRYKGEAL